MVVLVGAVDIIFLMIIFSLSYKIYLFLYKSWLKGFCKLLEGESHGERHAEVGFKFSRPCKQEENGIVN